ncbi:MAG: non-ribosomal peptide synthetase, partial [Alphaproteobacteria bacterium]|nr:non-ribosomal peptide synthetase [Alphaproteobacteria bacterium]
INYINYARKNYLFSGGAAFLHSSISFDLSITSLFLPLVVGRPIYLLPFDSSIDILGEFLKKKNNFKLLKLTPSHLKALEGQFNSKELFQNGSLIIGGENLLKKELEPWLEVMPEALLFNEYGPTEATVGCCVFKINASPSFSLNSILIGSPIFNTICYVLDAHLELLPIGAIGELYVGGAGLARGYLNRPELTAERFIPNPFQTEGEKQNNKNPRLYKTGDLARWLPDGNLEYIGRNDFQVKIRGYRIELGEIENVLSSYEGITQSVVLTKEHAKTESLGNKYLVGYYVSEDQLNEGSILNYLSNRLPEYMIPSMLVHLNKLPLTFNGKLDRNALPEPELSNSDTYIEPRNDLEKKIRQIWAEVLGLSENNISIHDDFFRLGGNSMLAIRLVGKLNKELFRTLNLSSIFKNSSIEKLYCYLINTIDENKKGKEYEF